MGMNSRLLSLRSKQPGHDRTFRRSEQDFISALQTILDPAEFEVVDHPRDLARIIDGVYGVVPEAKITYLPTGRSVYFEVKKQGPRGNAEERAAKHHTVEFYRRMHEVTGLPYHPFVTVMCENLASDPRYTIKHPYFYEEGHYFLWVGYDLDLLADFLGEQVANWLKDDPAEGVR